MEIALIIIGIIFLAIWLWLTILGCIATSYDTTLDSFQRKAQILLVLLVPYFGAGFILHLVNMHSPDIIPKSWVPWPLNALVFGKDRSKNKNRNNNEGQGIDLSISDSQHSGSDSGGGSD